MSGRPSPSISPTRVETGVVPVIRLNLLAVSKLTTPLIERFRYTVTTLELALDTTTSIFPSPSKSPKPNDEVEDPVPLKKIVTIVNETAPVVCVVVFRMTTNSALLLLKTTSGFPSRSISAMNAFWAVPVNIFETVVLG